MSRIKQYPLILSSMFLLLSTDSTLLKLRYLKTRSRQSPSHSFSDDSLAVGITAALMFDDGGDHAQQNATIPNVMFCVQKSERQEGMSVTVTVSPPRCGFRAPRGTKPLARHSELRCAAR